MAIFSTKKTLYICEVKMKGSIMVMPIGMGMNGMYGMGGNFYQCLKQRYGCGHADFGEAPKPVEVPVEIIQRRAWEPMKPGFFGKYFYLRHM